MTPTVTLYVGIAVPLVEDFREWAAKIPPAADEGARQALLKAFPRREIGAYALQELQEGRFPPANPQPVLVFRTAVTTVEQRVEKLVGQWSGTPVWQLQDETRPIPQLDHRTFLQELDKALAHQPVRWVPRVGLTRQKLQSDLQQLRPELVALFCHGTPEGNLLFEDGRGRAVMVAGEELLPLLTPHPQATMLAACHSQTAVLRAGGWQERGILITVDARTPVEVAACAQFQSFFFSELLAGATAGAAHAAAVRFVASSDTVGDRAFAADEVPASAKFQLVAGQDARLGKRAAAEPPAIPPQFEPIAHVTSPEMRRGIEHFVGRQRETVEVIAALLPLGAGLQAAGQGDHRCVTLTKEGGIGKTALAVEVATWVHERGFFARGVWEFSCADLRLPGQLPARLLQLFGLPEREQRGDLVVLLGEWVRERFGAEAWLLVLDNLDDLVASTSPQELRRETRAVIERLLAVAPGLRVLATCRWPIGLVADEQLIPVLPLDEDEACEVFLSHLDPGPLRRAVEDTYRLPDSATRRLIRISGRHPQSLRLLARQLRRKGLSLDQLCVEAQENLLGKLRDPHADDEDDRRYRVERSYELSYRHLSPAGQQLFARLARFPAGIWCGEGVEKILGWHEVLGEDWKDRFERELDFFALVHFEDDASPLGAGFYRMLPSMLELARQKQASLPEDGWHKIWVAFWRKRLVAWNQMFEGKTPEELAGTTAGAELGEARRQVAIALFRATQASWLEFLAFARQQDPLLAGRMLLAVVRFTRSDGQRVVGLELAQATVAALRSTDHRAELAASLDTLGTVQHDLGELKATQASYLEALAIRRGLAAQHSADVEEAYVAETLNNLGAAQSDLGDPKAAQKSLGEALKIFRRLAKQHPAAFKEHVFAGTLNNLGKAQSTLGEHEAAQESFWKALEIFRRLSEQHPAAFEADVAMALNNLGIVQRALNKFENAQGSYLEALEIRRRLAEQHPAAFEVQVAMTLNNLGIVQCDLGDGEAAQGSYREALEIYAPLLAKYPRAYLQKFSVVLRNYTNLVPESPDDPWWQLWRQLNPEK